MKLVGRSDEACTALADELYGWSIPALLVDRARSEPKSIALRYKLRGLYRELTWAQYLDRVTAVGAGLLELGFQSGDRLAIMGDPRVEWLLADLGALSVGGISYGVYSTSSPEQVGYQIDKTATRYFVAEDQEHLDKLLLSEAAGSRVERIVVIDDRTLFLYGDERIITFEELEERGRARINREPDVVVNRISSIRPNDVAVITFTSGTGGDPKPAMHTHRDAVVGMTFPYLYFFDELRAAPHRTICYLALAHLVERSMSVWLPLISDCVPHLGQKGEGLRQLLAETQPTFLHAVPRIWEKLAAQIVVAVETSNHLARRSFAVGNRLAEGWLHDSWEGGRAPFHRRLLHGLARFVVFRPTLHKVGLAEIQGGFTGGAPIPPRVQAQWQAWGVPLRNAYGITEGTTVAAQKGRFPRPEQGLVVAYPKHVELAQDGEVLVSGRGLFAGYWNDPEATAAVLSDGVLHTGDIATRVDEGLRIVDRKKDIVITSGGKNLAPAVIENAIKASPYVSEAMVIADGRKFPSCLVELDFETVAEWARAHDVTYAGFTALTRQSAIIELIGEEIRKGNERLARVEQVKAFRIIPKVLDPEVGDTTPTRKVRRRHLEQLFEELVEDMYAERVNEG